MKTTFSKAIIMNKKQYIAPCVEICNVELENAILAASGVQGDAETSASMQRMQHQSLPSQESIMAFGTIKG